MAACGDDKDKDKAAPAATVDQVNVQAGVNDPQNNNIAVLAYLPNSVPGQR